MQSELLVCADWHKREAEEMRNFVKEYPLSGRMCATEAVHLDACERGATMHETWSDAIRMIVDIAVGI